MTCSFNKISDLKIVSIFVIFLYLTAPHVLASEEEAKWNRELTLENGLHILWNNQDPDFLIMEMRAPVKGYVAVGFSTNGAMRGSDIIMGWIDNAGEAHLKDLYAIGNMAPMEDESQDVELLLAEKHSDGHTVIRFRRRWDTCDKLNDFQITEDTVRLIWALSDAEPITVRGSNGGERQFIFPYHGPDFRGSKSLFLKGQTSQVKFPDELQTPDVNTYFWDVKMNDAKVKGDSDTAYQCKIFKAPQFTQDPNKKHQIIGYRPLIQPENKQWVHHINFFECHVPKSIGPSEDIFEQYLDHPGEECYKKNMPPEWGQNCITFPITWAIGAEGLMLPDYGGFPLWEGHNGTTWFMLEIHYDNPKFLKFRDNSGLRLFITDKTRENDFGQISIHNRFGQFQLIPPKSVNFKSTAFCTSECTNSAIPPEGITVTHALLHGHLTAKSIIVRHIRDGVELPPLAQDLHYDFNYQQMRSVDPPRKIYPGDILMTECLYDTMDRDKITFGGTSTRDEMCQSVVTVYPKISLSLCKTQTEFHNFFHALGIHRVEGKKLLEKLQLPYHPSPDQMFDPGDDAYVLKNGLSGEPEYPFDLLQVADPMTNPLLTVQQYLDTLNWTEPNLRERIWKQWWDGKQLAMCTGHGHLRIPLEKYYVNYPDYVPYKEPESQRCDEMKNTPNLYGASGSGTKCSFVYLYCLLFPLTFFILVEKLFRN